MAISKLTESQATVEWPVIAIHDRGMDLDHPQLAGRIRTGRNFDRLSPDPWASEGDHHGTLAALTALQIAKQAAVRPVRVTDASLQSWQASFEYAVATSHIVLCAWSIPKESVAARDLTPLVNACARTRLFVCAVENSGHVGFPACLADAVAVGIGPHSGDNLVPVDLGNLPEFDLYRIRRGRRSLDQRRAFRGTSAAAAVTAGAAAQWWTAEPHLTLDQLRERLRKLPLAFAALRDGTPPEFTRSFGIAS